MQTDCSGRRVILSEKLGCCYQKQGKGDCTGKLRGTADNHCFQQVSGRAGFTPGQWPKAHGLPLLPTCWPSTSGSPHFSVQAFGFLFNGPHDAGTAWEGFMPCWRGNLQRGQFKGKWKRYSDNLGVRECHGEVGRACGFLNVGKWQITRKFYGGRGTGRDQNTRKN